MKIKNNSNNKWEDYNCGRGVIITILPKETIEVDDRTGKLLIQRLGHPNWLTVAPAGAKVGADKPVKEVKKEDPKVEKPKVKKSKKVKK